MTEQPTTDAVLLIDRSSSYCGSCREMADPHQDYHRTIPPGMTNKPFRDGCGARFTRLSSNYAGQEIRMAALRMRPDLPWQPRMVEDSA